MYKSSMSPLHSQTSVPQHGPQLWWVRKGSHDTRQNQFKTQHCVPGPGTIVPRVHWSRIPDCSFALPRPEPDSWSRSRIPDSNCSWSRIPDCSFALPRPVNATEPRRRCHDRVAKAPTRWPSLSMPAERGWRKHWTKQKYRHDLLKEIQQNMF